MTCSALTMIDCCQGRLNLIITSHFSSEKLLCDFDENVYPKKQFLVATHQHLQVCLVKKNVEQVQFLFQGILYHNQNHPQIEFQLLAPVDQFEFQL